MGDRVGNTGARKFGQRVCRGDFHRLVDGAGLHVERAAENVGEAQHIVDLVWIVRASRRHDGVAAHFGDFLRRDLRIWVRHREYDGLVRHARHHLLRHRAGGGKPEKHVGSVKRLGERPRLGAHGMSRLPLVHALLAAPIDDPVRVAKDDVLVAHTHRLHEFEASDTRRARTVADHLHIG